jgi:hypothetical protein
MVEHGSVGRCTADDSFSPRWLGMVSTTPNGCLCSGKPTVGRAKGLGSMASQLPIYTGAKTATLPPRTVDLDSRVELVDHTAARPEPHLGANTRRGGAGNLI